MRVGLFAAPELPAQIAVDLAEQLPELLDRQHDGSWRVALAEEPLLAGRESVEEILDAGCYEGLPIEGGWEVQAHEIDRRTIHDGRGRSSRSPCVSATAWSRPRGRMVGV